MKTGIVKEFRDEYFFLSNFYPGRFTWRNLVFPSGEHAFSYAKGDYATGVPGPHYAAVLRASSPGAAKGLGRRIKIDVDRWDANKVRVMQHIVHARFSADESGKNLDYRLLNTGAMMLVEGNDWNDTFWGRCGGKGQNVLGVLLMEERSRLRWS